jgi:uncharacterized membrane protein (DUF485 family)
MGTGRFESRKDWSGAVATPEFRALIAARRRLIVPLVAIYLVTYMGLTLLCGFAREFAGAKVLGPINLGFALIVLNYLVTWGLGLVYVRVAGRRHDDLARAAAAALPRLEVAA